MNRASHERELQKSAQTEGGRFVQGGAWLAMEV